jgi:Protein of unknown function (DUF2934)
MMDTVDLIDRIRRRAYEIWEREGWPHGRHLDHWLRAASEIRGSPKTPGPAGKSARRKKRSTRESAPVSRSPSRRSRKQRSKT